MPRKSRIDYPGALHHIMVRGIERRTIFSDINDKTRFLERLGNVLIEHQTPCLAFAVMPNHVHLLLQTGNKSISRVMQSLLTGYAVYYNKKHKRVGKLYQNRFKSILCDRDEYLLELIRYIHLNPIRGKILSRLSQLDKSPWTGHSVIMGNKENEWLPVKEVLSLFGKDEMVSRERYREYIEDGIGEAGNMDLEQGGLNREMGGDWKSNDGSTSTIADERILGSESFMENVLFQAGQQEEATSRLKREGWNLEKTGQKVCQIFNVQFDQMFQRGYRNQVSKARALLCKWMCEDLGYKKSEIAEVFNISRPAITKLVKKGKHIEMEIGVSLTDTIGKS